MADKSLSASIQPVARLELPSVTLITVDGRPNRFFSEMAAKALRYSALGIDFASCKLLVPEPPPGLDPKIEFVRIGTLSGPDYSRFMIERLVEYVDTDFCLVVQADGFVHKPHLWRAEFLEYDYIGAPWPHTTAVRGGADITVYNLSEQSRVGNGGFSLRSRRLLERCASIPFEFLAQFPEDFIICRLCQPYLTRHGLRFAPVEVAASFAAELAPSGGIPDISRTFGFHGQHFQPERLLMSLASGAGVENLQSVF